MWLASNSLRSGENYYGSRKRALKLYDLIASHYLQKAEPHSIVVDNQFFKFASTRLGENTFLTMIHGLQSSRGYISVYRIDGLSLTWLDAYSLFPSSWDLLFRGNFVIVADINVMSTTLAVLYLTSKRLIRRGRDLFITNTDYVFPLNSLTYSGNQIFALSHSHLMIINFENQTIYPYLTKCPCRAYTLHVPKF